MSNPGNTVGGHKGNLNNSSSPAAISFHSREVLNQEFNGGSIDPGDSMEGKNPGNVLVGLKATINKPRASQEAKDSASERLNQMQ
ncbi:uncharacterized protein K441DRAFT_558991 [Cenococcum geophilum 1.58]|uniref:uncharacterized protein n=1 Tax=Cenococcum geophilum 1.58 TaxID=794803 RepID=UPI00358EDA4F|nr:hypothetical protein K441DRAFT_558991 [Cenococcum geophilum 1.58]